MISFPANTDIFVLHTPVSFACSIDGMIRYCRLILQKEPMDKAYFIFINKNKTQLRVLWYDGQGFSLCTKRFSQGSFKNWPTNAENLYSALYFFEAQILFTDGELKEKYKKKLWKKIA